MTEQIKQIEQIVLLPIDRIEPDPNQPRDKYEKGSDAYKEHLKHLAESLKNDGQDEAIHVRIHPSKEGYWMIVNGESRWTSKKNIGHKEIAAIIKTFANEDEVWLAQNRSNAQRKSVNQLTELRNYQSAIDRKNGNETLFKEQCKQNGHSPTVIKEKLKLLALPESALIAWEQKEIPTECCHTLLKASATEAEIKEVLPLLKGKTAQQGNAVITTKIAKLRNISIRYGTDPLFNSNSEKKPEAEESQKKIPDATDPKKQMEIVQVLEAYLSKTEKITEMIKWGLHIPLAFKYLRGEKKVTKKDKKKDKTLSNQGVYRLLHLIKANQVMLKDLENLCLQVLGENIDKEELKLKKAA